MLTIKDLIIITSYCLVFALQAVSVTCVNKQVVCRHSTPHTRRCVLNPMIHHLDRSSTVPRLP